MLKKKKINFVPKIICRLPTERKEGRKEGRKEEQ